MLRRISRKLQLRVAVGSVGLGPTILAAKDSVELAVLAEGLTLWRGEGGLRHYFADAEEIWLPVNRDVGPFVKDVVLLTLKAAGVAKTLRDAGELQAEVYDRIRRHERSRMLAEKVEGLVAKPAAVRGSRIRDRVHLAEGYANENDGGAGFLVLGLMASRLAKAAGMEQSDVHAANFTNVMRWRLSACLQHLRLELDRDGGA